MKSFMNIDVKILNKILFHQVRIILKGIYTMSKLDTTEQLNGGSSHIVLRLHFLSLNLDSGVPSTLQWPKHLPHMLPVKRLQKLTTKDSDLPSGVGVGEWFKRLSWVKKVGPQKGWTGHPSGDCQPSKMTSPPHWCGFSKSHHMMAIHWTGGKSVKAWKACHRVRTTGGNAKML